MSRNRDFLNKALRALSAHGASVTGIGQNGHTHIAFETEAGAGEISIASTPSDVRAHLNVASDIRRRINEIAARNNPLPNGTALAGDSVVPEQRRVRQAPFPARSKDRRAAYLNPGGSHSRGQMKRLEKARASKEPRAAIDPVAKAREILAEMETFTINELASAVERRRPDWRSIIAADAIGLPYLRGRGSRSVSKMGFGARFKLWVNRCELEERRKLWAARNEFILSLGEIAREYGDAMPERSQLVRKAAEFADRMANEACAFGRPEAFSHEWPCIYVYDPEVTAPFFGP